MDLKAYLERIRFAGEARPDFATLRALHRAHLQAIPYENLDVQFGRTVTIDPEAAFDKIVTRRRGGWCFEMNGLFGAVLMEIGFKVTRMAGAATREVTGDSAIGNHLVLLVDLAGEPWIADVGFGDGSLEPFPLTPAAMTIGGYALRLEALDDRWWRFHNHEFGGAKSFDFTLGPADPTLLAEKCRWLQSAPESGFVQNAVAQRFRGDEIVALRGRVLRRVRPGGKQERILASADELVAVLAADFGLDLPEAAGLWPRIVARHAEVMAAAAEAAATVSA
jgi:N-hydroxyarylamine O-acetyltransferase